MAGGTRNRSAAIGRLRAASRAAIRHPAARRLRRTSAPTAQRAGASASHDHDRAGAAGSGTGREAGAASGAAGTGARGTALDTAPISARPRVSLKGPGDVTTGMAMGIAGSHDGSTGISSIAPSTAVHARWRTPPARTRRTASTRPMTPATSAARIDASTRIAIICGLSLSWPASGSGPPRALSRPPGRRGTALPIRTRTRR